MARNTTRKPRQGRKSAPQIEELEPRLLLSADAASLFAPEDYAAHQPVTDILLDDNFERITLTPTPADADDERLELVFVDTDTPDYQQLVDDLLNERNDGRLIDLVVLDNERDGIAQITETLQAYNSVDAIHLISHGSDGNLDLGTTRLSNDSLAEHQLQLQGWGVHLGADADILIYGCNLAASEAGEALVDALAVLTGADVAASDDLTGHENLGGDWELEYQVGPVETAPFAEGALSKWTATLDAAQVSANYLTTPLAFEANLGQVDAQVDFLARGSGYSVFLSDGDAVLALQDGDAGHAVHLGLVGSNKSAAVTGQELLGSYSNYLMGSDSAAWHQSVANHASVVYHGVYDGIDLRYYGNQRQFEYDFIVAAGADAGQIQLDFDGVASVSIADNGDLLLVLSEQGDQIMFKAPIAFQLAADGERESVASQYRINEDGTVGFALGEYDASRTLVIDPILSWASYFGGTGTESITDIALDASGNVYVTGSSSVPTGGLPITAGPFGTPGAQDAFVAKFSNDGTTLLYSTYFGGGSADTAEGIVVDGAGNIYVTGNTYSSDFPKINGNDTARSGSKDAYVVKINAAGTAIDYGTYLGGSGGNGETVAGIVLDPSGPGRVVVAGDTDSDDLPTKNAYDTELGGTYDGFIAAYDTMQTGTDSLLYSSYFGGSDGGGGTGNESLEALAIDAAGNIYITGHSSATSEFPLTANAYDATTPTSNDAYVTKLKWNGGTSWSTLYSSYIASDAVGSSDVGDAIAVDGSGFIYVAGKVSSSGFPTKNAYETSPQGGNDIFFAKFNPAAATGPDSLVYSTYFGGSGTDTVNDITVDAGGNVYATGYTGSGNLPLTGDAHDILLSGTTDAFVIILGAGGNTLDYSTYLGGDATETGYAIALDTSDDIYIAGKTGSTTGLATGGAFDTTYNGSTDGFVARFTAPNTAPTAANDAYSMDEDTSLVVASTTTNLVESWQFDEGTGQTAADAVAPANDGTLGSTAGVDIDDPTWSAGRIGNAGLTFDGVDDYVATTSTVLKTAPSFTLSAWFQPDITTGQHHLLWQGYAGGNGYGDPGINGPTSSEMSLTVGTYDQDNKIAFFLGYDVPENGADSIYIVSTSNFTDTTQWHHVGVTVEDLGGGVFSASLYVDGVLEGTDTGIQNDRSQWGSLLVGQSGAGTRLFDGQLDEVRIYDTALSPAELARITHGGVLENDSDDPGDILDAILVAGPSDGTLSLSKDGSFEYTPDPDFSGSDSFTYKANDGVLDSNTATVTITVDPINDAPVLAGANNLTGINKNPVTNNGTLVSDLISGQVTDPDTAPAYGIAVTAVDDTNGTWQYTTNSGSNWFDLAGAAPATARLLTDNASTFVRFVPDTNWNGTVTNGLTFHAWDQTSGSAGGTGDVSVGTAFSTASAISSITVTAVNTVPVVTASGGNTAYSEQATATAIDTALTLADPDGTNGTEPSSAYTATAQITAAYDAGKDVLAFTDTADIEANLVGDTLTLSVIGGQTASIADFQAALRSVTFYNGSDTPSKLDRTISFTFNDGLVASNTTTKVVQVSAVNDVPVNSVPPGQGVDEDVVLVFSSGNGNQISVADDSGNQPIEVTLTATNGTLTLSTLDRLVFSVGSGTGDASMTFIGTQADINAALEGMSFLGDSDFNGAANISLTTNDLGSEVIGNDLVFGSSVAPGVYNKEQLATQFSITENGTIDGVTAYFYVDKPEDIRFGIYSDLAGEPGTLLVEGTANVATGTGWYTIPLTPTAVTAGDYWIAWAPGKEAAHYYDPTGGTTRFSNYDPSSGLAAPNWSGTYASNSHSVSIFASFSADGAVALSDTDNIGITVDPVNDAAVVTASGGNTAYSEQATATAIDGAITLVDVDGTNGTDPSNLYTATIQVTGNYEAADVLGFTDTLDIQGSLVGDTLTLSVIGGRTASVADFEAALRNVTFYNGSDAPSELDRTVSFTFNDGLIDSNTTNRTVTVTAVNDAPENTVPGAQSTPVNTPLVFDTTNSNLVSISDIDAGASEVKVTLAATNGTLTLGWPSAPPATAGSETIGNTYPTGVQTTQQGFASAESVAMDANGNYVIVWQSDGQDGDGSGTYAQLYNADGTTNGIEFRVNVTTVGSQREPTVAMDAAGNFVVVWTGNGVGDGEGIYYRRFDANGAALDAAEQLVNTTTADQQRNPAVAMDASGDFVIAWAGSGAGDADGVFYRRFDAAGTAKDVAEVRVNTTTDEVQRLPAVAVGSDGNFAIAWDSDVDLSNADDWDIFVQRYDASGNTIGSNTQVNTYTTDAQQDASITMDASGNVVVAWESDVDPSNSDDFDIYLQRYDSGGSLVGINTLVNTTTAEAQENASVAVDTNGNFTVTWSSDDDLSNGVEWNVYLQKFDNAGATIGVETRVNSTVAGDQQGSSIAMDASGDFVIAWNGQGTGDTDGIFAQRFTNPTGLIFITGGGSNDTTMIFTGTVADINTALDGLVFTPDNGFNGAATATITTDDQGNTGTGGALSDSDVVNITVGSPNVAPVITASGGNTAYSEQAAATAIDTAITLVDPDGANGTDPSNLYTATVEITGNYTVDDLLGFTDTAKIEGSLVGDTLTLSVVTAQTASVAEFEAALRSVTFYNGSNTPSELDRTVSFTFNDGLVASNTTTKVVEVTEVNDPLTGSVTIDGTVTQGQGLTANTTALGDLDGLNTFTYQWYRGATPIGANAATYTLVQADVGANITVDVSYTDGAGNAESDTSAAVGPVANINDAPVLAGANNLTGINENPVTNNGTLVSDLISGQVTDPDTAPAYGIAVTAVDDTNGTWQYTTNSGTSWLDFDPVTTATARLLTDNASTFVRFVPDTNWNGTVTNGLTFHAWDQTSGTAGGTGDVSVGTAFSTASASSSIAIGAVNNIPVVTASGGATTYNEQATATAIDTGITLVDADGTNGTEPSSAYTATIQITAGYDAGNDVLAFANTAKIEGSLSGDTLTLSVVTAQTASVAEFEAALRSVTFYNGSNTPSELDRTVSFTFNDGVVDSNAANKVVEVTALNDAPTGTVSISGTTSEGSTLTASNTLADADGLGTITYTWKADGSTVGTGTTYVLTAAEIGKTMTVQASYTDGHGTPEAMTSGPAGPVTNVNDPPTGSVTIDNTTPEQGDTLTASNDLVDPDGGPGAVTYTWKADGSAVGTGTTYLLTEAEVGKNISVEASYTDGGGTNETIASNPTSAVTNVNDDPTGTVSISGTTSEGSTLTASNTLADADGLGTITYTWKADGSTVGTGTTYVLTATEIGKTMTVQASYTDGHGTPEAVTSGPAGPVTNVNDPPTGSVTIDNTTPAQGDTLTASNDLADPDGGPGAVTYTWKADGSTVGTGTTYLLTEAEVGKVITVEASYTDGGGTNETIASDPTSAVTNVNDDPTGTVSISGTTSEGSTLTASDTLADADGLGTITYTWKADGSTVGTGTTYLLTASEIGKTMTVEASYTDGHGTPEAVTSGPAGPVTNVNDPPTGSVTIDNTTPAQGDTLTASNDLADPDGGPGAVTYTWKADGSAVGTGTTYLLTEAEVGTVITVEASYLDGGGTNETIASNPTSAVTNVNDDPTGTVSISGTTSEGSTLTASNTLADADGLGTITYTWKADGSTVGTGTTYVLTASEIGKTMTVQASYTDGHGTPEAVTSSGVGPVTNVNDPPTGSVTIDNTTPEQGDTLTASNDLADPDGGPGAVTYTWKADGSTVGTGTTYLLTEAEVGTVITVEASYLDGGGTNETIASNPTSAVTNVNDDPTGTVSISGTTSEGSTLTASNTLADADGLGTITYTWKADGSTVGTGTTYVLTAAEIGKTMTVQASYTDGHGTPEAVTSGPAGPVTNVNDPPTGSVTIDNTTPAQGDTLTASNDLADPDGGPGAVTYTWKADGSAVGTGTTYLLTEAEVGKNITVEASYTDGGGTNETIASNPTSAVTNVNDDPTGTVSISGTTSEGSTLTASNTLADADGLGTITYTWKADGSTVGTGTTYLLTASEIGKTMTVEASYTDGHGTPEAVNSGPAGPVTNVNDPPTGTVTISGTASEDQVLTASNTLADSDGMGTVSYQWFRGATPISTGTTYTLVQADVGQNLSVVANYTDGGGTNESVSSAGFGPIANTNDAPTGAPGITGTAKAGQTLTAVTGGIADEDGLGTFSHTWQRSTDGGTSWTAVGSGSSYLLGTPDVGADIRVQVAYTDAQGSPESLSSTPVVPVPADVVAPPPPPPEPVPEPEPTPEPTPEPVPEPTPEPEPVPEPTPEPEPVPEPTPEPVPEPTPEPEPVDPAPVVAVEPTPTDTPRGGSDPIIVSIASTPPTDGGSGDSGETDPVVSESTDPATDAETRLGGSTRVGRAVEAEIAAQGIPPEILELIEAGQGAEPPTAEAIARQEEFEPTQVPINQLELDRLSRDARTRVELAHVDAVMNNPQMWREIDAMKKQMDEPDNPSDEFVVEMVSTTGVGLMAGLVAYALRGGALLASLMSTMPLWTGYDPMPILVRKKDEKKKPGGDQAEGEEAGDELAADVMFE